MFTTQITNEWYRETLNNKSVYVLAMAYERHKMGVEFNDGVASAIVNEWEEDNEEEMQALADKMKGLKGD